jgi:hypothetical protein
MKDIKKAENVFYLHGSKTLLKKFGVYQLGNTLSAIHGTKLLVTVFKKA